MLSTRMVLVTNRVSSILAACRSSRPAARSAAGFMVVAALGGCAHVARTMMITQMKIDALFSPKEISVELNRSFIEQYQDRVTMTTRFIVDAVTSVPNGPLFDGDLHIAGRAREVGLPVVVEVINAASQKPAMDLLHRAKDTGKPLTISGAWRIWPEHGGREPAVQEEKELLDALTSPFASHVFEIHPATRIQDIDLSDSFRPGDGYRPGHAKRTFKIYENATATLKVTDTTIALVTQEGLYNDVHFLMEIAENRQVVAPGGRFVTASARSLEGELLVERLRMVFVKGTGPERAVQHLKLGDRLHVWGLPRINYAEISRMALDSPPRLTGPLPYEIIVLGVYQDK